MYCISHPGRHIFNMARHSQAKKAKTTLPRNTHKGMVIFAGVLRGGKRMYCLWWEIQCTKNTFILLSILPFPLSSNLSLYGKVRDGTARSWTLTAAQHPPFAFPPSLPLPSPSVPLYISSLFLALHPLHCPFTLLLCTSVLPFSICICVLQLPFLWTSTFPPLPPSLPVHQVTGDSFLPF